MPGSSLHLGPVPKGFVPASVTFVSLHDAWVLGSAPCSAPERCLVLLRTADAGRTWASVPAPPDHLSLGYQGGGVRTVRFADVQNGWVFQPDLWATHDGGAHWSRSILVGVPAEAPFVMALETSAGVVHAAAQSGDGAIDIESSPVGQDAWRMSPTTVPVGAGPVPRVVLVLHGASGWLVEVDRTVIGGARLDHGRWSAWQPPCLTSNGPEALAASSQTDLVAVCDQGVWGPPMPEVVRAYFSSDGGATFRAGSDRVPSFAFVIASPSPGAAVVDVSATFDAGRTWRPVLPAAAQEGAIEIGFTSATQGVLITGNGQMDSAAGEMLMTFDGGHAWSAVAFRSG